MKEQGSEVISLPGMSSKVLLSLCQLPSCLLYKARLIIETRFENSSVRRSKLGVRLILEVLGIAM